MPRLQQLCFCLILLCSGLISTVQAHYLWVKIDPKAGEHGTANVYFEESAAPGDGHYLDPIMSSGKTWIRTIANPKPALVKTTEVKQGEKKRWLTAPLPASGPRSVDSYAKFGVYRYGKDTDVLLHYYARFLEVDSHEQLHELSRAEQLDLDMVVHDHAADVEVRVLWKGKAATERLVYIRGPRGFKQNLKTSDSGRIRFTPEAAGRYWLRTNIELDTPGREGDKDYSLIRHHATFSIALPLKK